jgi:hypothetical protein
VLLRPVLAVLPTVLLECFLRKKAVRQKKKKKKKNNNNNREVTRTAV